MTGSSDERRSRGARTAGRNMILSTEELAALRTRVRMGQMSPSVSNLHEALNTDLANALDYIDTLRQENAALVEVNVGLLKAVKAWCPFDLNDEDW